MPRPLARGLFVTGTDTGVGKTVLSAALVATMVAEGEPVCAHKPVVTGVEEDPPSTGGSSLRTGQPPPSTGRSSLGTGQPPPSSETPPSAKLAAAWPPDHELLAAVANMAPEEVSPLRYGPAVSPHLAAALAGESIDPERLLEATNVTGTDARTLVVEGVGGLLTPLTEDFAVRDYAAALGLPVLIAARPGLGTINHTLLTLQSARAAGLDVRAVVLTPWRELPSQLERSNRETIARLGAIDVEILSYVSGPDPTGLAIAGATLPWRRWLEEPLHSLQ
jgi:dethiobiotin synthetase